MRASEEPFTVASGHSRRSGIVGGWRICMLVTLLLALCRVWKEAFAECVVEAMADRGHSAPECRCLGLLHGRSQGGRGGARPSIEGEDPCKNWFRMENLAEETQALMRLEGKLKATLLFEHGKRQPTSILLVSCILLGRMFRERLALGRTMKAFAKHYHKEVMRSLVNIQDLVDLAEPPLGGFSMCTLTGQRQNDEMELNAGEEEQESSA